MLTSKNSSHTSSTAETLIGGVKKTIGATLLALELTIGPITTVAVIGSGISKGDYSMKVENGIKAPERLFHHIENLPRDLADTEKLIETLNTTWSVEKIHELIKTGRQILNRIYEREKERVGDMIVGLDNYKTMPSTTIAAILTVLILFMSVKQGIRLLRLGDRESILDGFRRDLARLFGSNSRITTMTDSQLEKEIELLIQEKKKRVYKR